jgi:hypothetical protein
VAARNPLTRGLAARMVRPSTPRFRRAQPAGELDGTPASAGTGSRWAERSS